METFREIRRCRSCGSTSLTPILKLGNLYISDFVEDKEAPRGKAPLELVLCENCSLLQLKHTTNPELLFRQYYYRSSQNPIMVEALRDVAIKAQKYVTLKDGDAVIDIGANDGTLLSFMPNHVTRVGFEPAINLLPELKNHCNIAINDFFSYQAFKEHLGNRKAKLITAIACFYDLEDPNMFLFDVQDCLDEKGIFIIEQRYLPSMLEQNDIGNVTWEHLTYYSLLSLEPLLERHGLQIFDVELNDVNGGSFRTYIQHKGGKFRVGDSVEKLKDYEKKLSLDTAKPYEEFATRVEDIKHKVHDFIEEEHAKGKRIYSYGASTKGNTVLQYFALDNTLIEAAAERDPRKWGRRCVGTWIPIISEEEARQRADYFLVLIWFYKKAIIERERSFLETGGKLIFPFPKFEVVEHG
jgi:hypothetical protein